MKKIFSFNLIKQDIKQNWWIMFMFFILFLWMLVILISIFEDQPLDLSVLEREDYQFYTYDKILNSINILSTLIFVIGTTVTSLLLFGYMHNKKTIDFYHSLPFKREVIFMSKYVSGIILYFIPFLLAICITILTASFIFENNFSYFNYHMFSIFVTQFIAATSMYTIITFFAAITGLHIIQFLCFYGIAVVPSLTISLLYRIREMFLPSLGGYDFNNLTDFIYGFIIRPVDLLNFKVSPSYPSAASNYLESLNYKFLYDGIWVDILLIIVICIVTIHVYGIRKSEKSGEPVVFNSIKAIIKYGMAFCGSIILTVFFLAILESRSKFTALISILIFYILFYLIMEVILNKGFQTIKTNLKYMALLSPLPVIVFYLVISDVLGLEKKIPNLEDVQSVSFYNDSDIPLIVSVEDKTISEIIDYHSFLADNYLSSSKSRNSLYNRHIIRYNLKDGNTINRFYSINYDINHVKYLNNIFNSAEYKDYVLNILNDLNLQSSFYHITYTNLLNENKHMYNKELLNSLISDIENDKQFSLFDVIGFPAGLINISFGLPYDSELLSNQNKSFRGNNINVTRNYNLSFFIKKSYVNTIDHIEYNTNLKPHFYDIHETIYVKKVMKQDFMRIFDDYRRNIDDLHYGQNEDGVFSNYLLDFDYELKTREEKENFINNTYIYNIPDGYAGYVHTEELYLENFEEFYIAYILNKNNSINLIWSEFTIK